MSKPPISRLFVLDSCQAGGEHLQEGETYDVPGQVSEADARLLIKLGKGRAAEPETEAEKPKKA